MKEATLIEVLRQVSEKEIGQIFRGWLKDITKDVVVSVMLQEVEELCGPFYRPDHDSEFKRGGSTSGKIVIDGVAEDLIRPRVRRKCGPGKEVGLLSYAAASDGDDVARRILRALAAGVSSRDVGGLHQGGLFASKSSVSRLCILRGLSPKLPIFIYENL